jgi:hypothetical protein
MCFAFNRVQLIHRRMQHKLCNRLLVSCANPVLAAVFRGFLQNFKLVIVMRTEFPL